MALLQVDNMTHYFGGLRAVHDYSLVLEPGHIVGLIGPNGAGKTTIFNLISGIHTPSEGNIELDGKNLIGHHPHEIAAMGLGRTFQNLLLWRHMTVLEHVKMACYSQLEYSVWGAFFGSPLCRREEKRITAKAMHLLETFDVAGFSSQLAVSLPYGAQRRVEMARAMATNPRVLFLDEPTAGMTPDELNRMINIIRKVHADFEVAILLIEHRLKFVMELCERIQTLVFGEVIAEGSPEEIRNNPEVIEAYLGREDIH
jgi:branched-chain amino acid transport system ATP-binding protein